VNLLKKITEPGITLIDGAMGTELGRRGLTEGGQNCILNPEVVTDIHRQYAAAGAELLITNTLTMNRIYLETHNLDIDVKQVNIKAVELARAAARDGQFVLGDISSTGKLLEPYGEYKEEQFVETFMEQATLLADAGVDGFIIETMIDLREMICAVKACKKVSSLPIIAAVAFATYKSGGRTVMGDTAEQCARRLTEEGVSAVGANCGDLDPLEMAEVVSLLRDATDLPILAEPNAGKPRLEGTRTVFDLGLKDFAAGVLECVSRGATLVGGCCGTTSDHIRALAAGLNHLRVRGDSNRVRGDSNRARRDSNRAGGHAD
jgi:5-methyltetrahydrofolate--homocysteine methyltransferase